MALVKLKEFCIPESPGQVSACAAKYGDNALILGGGSFIHGLEARGLLSEVEALIDIRKLGLAGMAATGEGVRIGAMTTFAELEKLPELASAAWLGALKDALTYPPMQIKNVATVGGCIAASCPFFDIPTAFLALDAKLTVSGAGAKREIGLAELFAGLFENSLEPGELITEVRLAKPAGRAASAFIKLEGTANDLAIVNAAVRISVDAAGVCQEVRIALGGGVGDSVVRSASAEKLLLGQKLSADLIQHAAEAVGQDISPMEDHRATAAYRLAMAKVITRRALNQALSRLN
ncbi:MAG: FAD binding domain-containing protein [Betaproteobacteria bacterium]|nr:FAD binding domain-containing protein [Betaproteobacteria bacterium]